MDDNHETVGFLDSSSSAGTKGIVREERHFEKEKPGKSPLINLAKKTVATACSKKALYKRLPVINWMKNYNGSFFLSDLLAGLTVGLTAIPQGIAYAVVAGLEPQYGLYSGFMGCFVYYILGSVKDITIGPTAIMALMAQKSVEGYNSDFAVLLCFLTGCIILLAGILQLGFLVNFISVPVTVGFTTAAAITIASSQLKGLLGISGKTNEFVESWISVFEHIKETRYQDLSLSLISIFCLVTIKVVYDKVSQNLKKQTTVSRRTKVFYQIFRLVALGRNAIIVILGTLAAYLFEINGMTPFKLTGKVAGGLPQFKPPPFSTYITNDRNQTVFLPFEEMVSVLGTGLIFVPMISVLETIAIAKAFAKGKSLDATQEMIALGACNILGSFASSMPTAGSFTRTAVNNASGVKTPLGGLFTGILVLSALSLTATFKYIPKATLAAVIVTAMFYMVETHELKLIWRTKKSDLIPTAVTILGCLFLSLDYGIMAGIVVNSLFILYNAARPKLIIKKLKVSDREILLVCPQQTLIYPAAEYMRESVIKALVHSPSLIVIDGRNICSVDVTVAKNLKTLIEDLEKTKQNVTFWNWSEESMSTCLRLDGGFKEYFQQAETINELMEERKNQIENV